MPNGITSIEIAHNLGNTPASTHRPTGKVWLNSAYIGVLPKEYWDFIIAHEEGHIVGDNRSEIVADAYASTKFFAKYPQKPFMSVDALKNVLPMNTAEQQERVNLQVKRAAKFDCAQNGNAKSCAMIYGNQVSNFSASDGWCGPACEKKKATAIQAEADLKKAQQEGADAITIARLKLASQLATLEALKYGNEAEVKQTALELQAQARQAASGIDGKKVLIVALIAAAALAVLFILNSGE